MMSLSGRPGDLYGELLGKRSFAGSVSCLLFVMVGGWWVVPYVLLYLAAGRGLSKLCVRC